MTRKNIKKYFYSFVLGIIIGFSSKGVKIGNLNQVNNTFTVSNGLDEYLPTKSFDDVYEAIKSNSNLSYEDKLQTNYVVKRLEQKIPDIDLRCFYENVKDVKIKRVTKKEITELILNDKTEGYFDANKRIIVVSNNKEEVLNHEILHMLDSINILKHGVRTPIQFEENHHGTSTSEGINEKLNLYLFDYDNLYENYPPYKESIKDIDIFKYIFKLDEEEIIKTFKSHGYSYLIDRLTDYVDKKDAKELIEICDKETRNLFDEEKISIEDLEKKYSILTEACIVSRGGKLTEDETFQIYHLLFESYSHYSNEEKITKRLTNLVMKTLLKYGKNKDTDIKIKENGISFNYYDIKNVYLAYNKKGTSSCVYRLVEPFKDTDGEIKNHCINDYIFGFLETDNTTTLTPVTELIEEDKNVTVSDLTDNLIKTYQKRR